MAGIPKVHGSTLAGAFYGYQPLFLKVTGNGVGTADTVSAAGLITADGNFGKAIRAIQLAASIVFISPREDGGFVVAVDAPTASDNGESSVAARMATVVGAATGVSATVVAVTLAASTLA